VGAVPDEFEGMKVFTKVHIRKVDRSCIGGSVRVSIMQSGTDFACFLTSILHDVNLTTSWPGAVVVVRWNEPECRP
jgi:hypothetical protein